METCAAGGELDNYTGIRDTAWDLEKVLRTLEVGAWFVVRMGPVARAWSVASVSRVDHAGIA